MEKIGFLYVKESYLFDFCDSLCAIMLNIPNCIPKIRKYLRQGEACSVKFFGGRDFRFNPVLLTAISKGSSDHRRE